TGGPARGWPARRSGREAATPAAAARAARTGEDRRYACKPCRPGAATLAGILLAPPARTSATRPADARRRSARVPLPDGGRVRDPRGDPRRRRFGRGSRPPLRGRDRLPELSRADPRAAPAGGLPRARPRSRAQIVAAAVAVRRAGRRGQGARLAGPAG